MAHSFSVQALLPLALLLFPEAAVAEDWSRFRGPNGSGVSAATGLPEQIEPGSEEQLWVTEVPFGRSSPVLGGGRIFLTAVEDGKLVTLALDRETGETLWRRELERAHTARLHKDTDSATPSPVTDGANVYVFFHEAGMVSYDPSGKERWRVPLGPFRNYYGCASSPLHANGLVVVGCDQAEGSFLLAVDAATGKTRWRRERPGRLESYSTPILYPDEADPELVMIYGSRFIDAYHLATGEDAWSVPGVGSGPVASPVLVGDTLYLSAHDHAEGGWPDFAGLLEEHDGDKDGDLSPAEVAGVWLANHFGWLDTDASGKITADDWKRLETELVNEAWGAFAIRLPVGGAAADKLWNYRKNHPYIPSPLVHDDVFYMVKDGFVTALDAETGEPLKLGRLGGAAKVYASPVAADGKIYIGTLQGKLAVIDAGRDWEIAATHDLGEPIHASPAILDGRIYLRTESKLYGFGRRPEEPTGQPGEPTITH